jgi:pimeloyl-ACP methyl ester carboxylesterase/DNA-binding CsgD family transcriptional regulator
VTEPEIRFCEAGGVRVAYATVGSGPPLVLPASWAGHLEVEWTFPEFRAFVGALARAHTVVRYDRPGTGLSDREGVEPPTVDGDVRTLTAVIDALGADAVALLGLSFGACAAAVFAARHPERVTSLAAFGGVAAGADAAPAALREAIVATVRAHWGAGSRMLADVWVPGTDADTRERFVALQRSAADAETAAAVLEAIYATDIRDALAGVRAPTIVLHRRADRAIPFALGRDLAAHIPGARLVALDGEIHLAWLGDADAVLAALGEEPVASGESPAAPASAPAASGEPPAGPAASGEAARGLAAAGKLSDREREVLRLVADGLGDAEIAERLVVSPHTVHRHVANIRTKLRQPSRAAAAAHAVRNGLI